MKLAINCQVCTSSDITLIHQPALAISDVWGQVSECAFCDFCSICTINPLEIWHVHVHPNPVHDMAGRQWRKAVFDGIIYFWKVRPTWYFRCGIGLYHVVQPSRAAHRVLLENFRTFEPRM